MAKELKRGNACRLFNGEVFPLRTIESGWYYAENELGRRADHRIWHYLCTDDYSREEALELLYTKAPELFVEEPSTIWVACYKRLSNETTFYQSFDNIEVNDWLDGEYDRDPSNQKGWGGVHGFQSQEEADNFIASSQESTNFLTSV